MIQTYTNPIAFAKMRWLLKGFRYKERTTDNARIFYRSKKYKIAFRRYGDLDTVDWNDVLTARRFLSARRVLKADEFDAFVGLTIRRSKIAFTQFCQFLASVGYRHMRTDRAEIFYHSKKRRLFYPCYYDQEFVSTRDLADARDFLDAWGHLAAADFDAFLESATKPA